jgi:hypothetical protein
MSVVSDVKSLWSRCGKDACRCAGVFILSFGIAAGGMAHSMHPAVLPGQGEPPHTEHQMDTRQTTELPKLSASTASTIVFRATMGPGFRLSGFWSGATSAMDTEG